MSKQVTAYNAVNNSTVSRTSASKYGEFIKSFWGRKDAPWAAVVTRAALLEDSGCRQWGVGRDGESGRLAPRKEHCTQKKVPGSEQGL